jgi:methionyl-tRNA formyltransferase
MRIVLIGQAAFGESVLKRLEERGFEVVGVSAPAPKEGGTPDPLWAAAQAAGLPVLETRRLRRAEVFEQYAALKPELNVMAFVTDIIRTNVLTLPAFGTIQYHPSLLPRHRGISSINWAVAQGDTKTGLTVFWVDEGIDTGPILLQKEIPIGPDDTVGSLYFGQLFALGVDAMVEAVELVQNGTAPRIVQDESQATYEPPFTEEQAHIDWSAPAAQIYNLIRACNPQPGAVTSLHGEPLKIFDVERLTDGDGSAPGTITAVDDAAVTVSIGDASLRLKRVSLAGSGKIQASQWAARAVVRAGMQLGR